MKRRKNPFSRENKRLMGYLKRCVWTVSYPIIDADVSRLDAIKAAREQKCWENHQDMRWSFVFQTENGPARPAYRVIVLVGYYRGPASTHPGTVWDDFMELAKQQSWSVVRDTLERFEGDAGIGALRDCLHHLTWNSLRGKKGARYDAAIFDFLVESKP